MFVSYNVKHLITIRPKDPAPNYLPKINETHVYKKTCTLVFIEALFIIEQKTGNKSNILQLGNQKQTNLFIQWNTTQQLKGILPIHTTPLINLRLSRQNESQTQKTTNTL